MTWTERTKETDTSTERVHSAAGYDFSMHNIFWDRTDIYFDNVNIHATERTKESDTATERTKEIDTAVERTKESDTATERIKET